jgi:hypothetical protein
MGRRKGFGTVGLVLIALMVLATALLVTNLMLDKAIKIKSQAKIFVDLSDQTSSMASLMKSKTGDIGYMDALEREIDSLDAGTTGEEISRMADQMDISIIVYDNNGKIKKGYGSRKYVHIIPSEIPLPGGRTSIIGLGSDVQMPDEKSPSGGTGSGAGGR